MKLAKDKTKLWEGHSYVPRVLSLPKALSLQGCLFPSIVFYIFLF